MCLRGENDSRLHSFFGWAHLTHSSVARTSRRTQTRAHRAPCAISPNTRASCCSKRSIIATRRVRLSAPILMSVFHASSRAVPKAGSVKGRVRLRRSKFTAALFLCVGCVHMYASNERILCESVQARLKHVPRFVASPVCESVRRHCECLCIAYIAYSSSASRRLRVGTY